MFLVNNLGAKRFKSLTTVDISQEMLECAERFFGFDTSKDSPITSVCADAFEHLEKQAPASLDMAFIDLNFEEENVHISPPLKFLTP